MKKKVLGIFLFCFVFSSYKFYMKVTENNLENYFIVRKSLSISIFFSFFEKDNQNSTFHFVY